MGEILIPEIPQEIIDAINSDSLAVFVGAGVSAIAGLPLWSQLAKNLICECYSNGLYSYKDKELILERIQDNKQLITVAFGKLKEAGLENTFFEILKKHLELKSQVLDAGTRIFSWLRDTMSLVLTTNADELLHEYFELTRIHDIIPNVVDEMPLQRARLVHLHGVISNKDTLVFTTKQYLQRYQTPQYQEYLKAVFTTKTVLFIGYGMSEFELLDFLIQKTNSAIQHFIMVPYFTYTQPIATAMKEYYSELGIKQIDYYIDEKGYPYLADILDNWLINIRLKSNLPSRILLRIREIVKFAPSDDLIKEEALQMIKSDRMVEKEFFDNLTSHTQYDVDWLIALETSECFDPKLRNNPPKPSIESDSRTYYSAVPWYGFRRLLELAQAIPEDIDIRNMLTRVVRATILDTLNSPEKAGNWAISDAVAKSIVLLSPDDIGDSVWDYIQLVSNSSFALNQDIFTAEFSHNIEKIASWSTRQILRVLEMYFECNNKPGSESEYWLEQITEKWHTRLVKLMPDSIVELCIKIIKQRYKVDEFKFWEVGAFAKFPDENGIKLNESRDYNASVIIWLRAAIEVLSPNSAIELVSEYIQSSCPIFRRMAIFTINYFFSSCGYLLFVVRGSNPFNDREILSDLFDLIKVNLPQMNHDQVEMLYKWIAESNFGIENDENTQAQAFRRAIFVSLFKEIKIEYLEDYDRYSGMVHREIHESDAYNISKHMYTVSSDFEHPDPEIISKLESRSTGEWPKVLADASADTTRMRLWGWTEAVEAILKKSPGLFIEDTTPFLEIPTEFTPYIIRAIDGYNFCDKEISVKTADFLLHFIERHNANDAPAGSVIDAFRLLRHHYLDDEHREFHKKIAQTLITWVRGYSLVTGPWNQQEDPILLMHNESFPVCVSLLVRFLAEIKSVEPDSELIHECLAYFHDQLIENELDWTIRCVLAAQLNNIAYINLLWLKEHLAMIFNKADINANIPVAICYVTSGRFFKDFYSFFSETGFFVPVLTMSNDDNATFINEAKRNLSAIAAYAFVHDLDDISVAGGLYNSVIGRIDAKMFMAGVTYFERQFAKEVPDDNISKASLESKFDSYLIESVKCFSDFENIQIFPLIKCVKLVHNLSLPLWDILLYLAEKCPEYSIYDEWFDFMQIQIDCMCGKIADLLIALIRNPKFSYLQEEKKDLLRLLLSKLHENGEAEKVRTIRNLLIGKGFTEFTEIA